GVHVHGVMLTGVDRPGRKVAKYRKGREAGRHLHEIWPCADDTCDMNRVRFAHVCLLYLRQARILAMGRRPSDRQLSWRQPARPCSTGAGAVECDLMGSDMAGCRSALEKGLAGF